MNEKNAPLFFFRFRHVHPLFPFFEDLEEVDLRGEELEDGTEGGGGGKDFLRMEGEEVGGDLTDIEGDVTGDDVDVDLSTFFIDLEVSDVSMLTLGLLRASSD
jgi:hypothetical protein